MFAALRRVVDDEGKAVALVSHKLAEIIAATDEVTIMRDGRVVERRPDGRQRASDAWPGRWSAAMSCCAASTPRSVWSTRRVHSRPPLGQRVRAAEPSPAAAGAATSPASPVTGRDGACCSTGSTSRCTPARSSASPASRATVSARLGDVLSSLSRHRRRHASRSTVVAVPSGHAGAMADAGVAVIPEDRHDCGCVLDFTVAENLFIVDPERVARHGLMTARRRCASAPKS